LIVFIVPLIVKINFFSLYFIIGLELDWHAAGVCLQFQSQSKLGEHTDYNAD
jgi:hypothetical protein